MWIKPIQQGKDTNTNYIPPLKIPKIKPKVLSTAPNPDQVTALLIALLMLIITKSILCI